MNYPANQGPNPHASGNQGHHPQPGGSSRGSAPGGGPRGDGADAVANVIRSVVGAVVAVFALRVLFVVFDANQGNEFVSVVYALAQALVLGLGDVFTPGAAMVGVVLNYGLAALVYLVVGQLIIKAIRGR